MKITKKHADLMERLTPIGYNKEEEAYYDIDLFLNALGINAEEAIRLLDNALQKANGKEDTH